MYTKRKYNFNRDSYRQAWQYQDTADIQVAAPLTHLKPKSGMLGKKFLLVFSVYKYKSGILIVGSEDELAGSLQFTTYLTI